MNVSRFAAASALLLLPLAGCSATTGEDASVAHASSLDSTVDMADYVIPNCDHAGSAWQIGSERFRVVPMGMVDGRGRFVIVKSADGSGYEQWSIDDQWLRLRADTTWAYEIPGGTWCDVKCGNNDAGNCQQRWNDNASDPRNGRNPSSPWAYTRYSDPDDANAGAPMTPRTMPLAEGDVYRFTTSAVIEGARRDSCATCAVNFATGPGAAVQREVSARRYANWHGFDDVVHLRVDSGPGTGEEYFYARGKGWIGFNGRSSSGEVASSTLPQTLCGGESEGSLCDATGQAGREAPPSPTPAPSPDPAPSPSGGCDCRSGVNNYCLYPPSTSGCGMTAPGGYCDRDGNGDFSDADWVRGYNEYKANCSSPAPAPAPAPSCDCRSGVNNYCLYPAGTSGCGMTAPGGYCDPDGNGDFSDADWVRGYYEYHAACP